MSRVVDRLTVSVTGRPAPQGSKRIGAYGQMREQSRYLPAWRAAVKLAVYRRYKELGIDPVDLPLFRGPVAFGGVFRMPDDRRADSDLDKLLRSTWDALTLARVWEDDKRVVSILEPTGKVFGGDDLGADLVVITRNPWGT